MGQHTVAIDTCVLVNLLHVGRLDLLQQVSGYNFVAPEEVVDEVTVPEQARGLADGIRRDYLRREAMSDGERRGYADLLLTMGDGEAACLAMAQSRSWLVATDERRRVLRTAQEMLGPGRVLNTPALLVLAIREGILSVEEADRIKAELEGRRFRMAFGSFREIMTGQRSSN